jgi:hypothetical protein
MADSPPSALIEASGSSFRRGQRPVRGSAGVARREARGAHSADEEVLLVLAAAAAWMALEHRRCHQQRQEQRQQLLPSVVYERRVFTLSALPQGNAVRLFRFMEQELLQLLPLLHFEDEHWRTALAPTPEAALCLVYARLAYLSCWLSLCNVFGRSEAWLSTMFNDAMLFLAARFGPLLWWHHQLTYSRLV